MSKRATADPRAVREFGEMMMRGQTPEVSGADTVERLEGLFCAILMESALTPISFNELASTLAEQALSAIPPQQVSVADAARVLLKEHGRCTAIRPADRTYLEKMAANIGRNRLRSLMGEKP